MKIIKFLMAIAIFFMFFGVAYAADMSVTLGWDANTESDLAGYRVYYGISSGNYTQPLGSGLDAGNNTQYKVEGLTYGTMYYFAVTAYDTEENESGYSNEVFTDGITGMNPLSPSGLAPMKIEVTRPDGTIVTINIP